MAADPQPFGPWLQPHPVLLSASRFSRASAALPRRRPQPRKALTEQPILRPPAHHVGDSLCLRGLEEQPIGGRGSVRGWSRPESASAFCVASSRRVFVQRLVRFQALSGSCFPPNSLPWTLGRLLPVAGALLHNCKGRLRELCVGFPGGIIDSDSDPTGFIAHVRFPWEG